MSVANQEDINAISLENLYRSSVECIGEQIGETRQLLPSLVREVNAFGLLSCTSALLRDERIRGDRNAENEEHDRLLRALASVDALTILEAALRPRTLEKLVNRSKTNIVSLIVHIAFVLDDVLSLSRGDIITQAPSNNKTLHDMREHLRLILVYHLHHLCSKVFSQDSKLFSYFGNASGNATLPTSFWFDMAWEISLLLTLLADSFLPSESLEQLAYLLVTLSEERQRRSIVFR